MFDYFKIQEAVIYASRKFDGIDSSKPTLLHSIRCGIMLMENNFSSDEIIAGILHDTVEDTEATVDQISELFGNTVASIVSANTKDPTIKDKNRRREELIERCCKEGSSATAVKLSDIYDNYKYYKNINNIELVEYCLELKGYVEKFIKPESLRIKFVSETLDKIK